ncbi:transposase, partial [Streptococcus pneumoniae MNZ41]
MTWKSYHKKEKSLGQIGLIEDNLKQVHPIFQTVFKTFLKDKEKIVNALQLHYSNAKLEA